MRIKLRDDTNSTAKLTRLASASFLFLIAACFLLPTAYCLLPTEAKIELSEPKAVNKEGWREAAAGYPYAFPRDHASHSNFKIEWWYYTGNLETKTGRRFGYQLTFFRTGVTSQPANPSRWAVRDLYMAHFCISDLEQKAFHSFEKLNRAGLGWAGAESSFYRVWNESWQAEVEGKDHLIKADSDNYQLDLRLSPEKAEVIHGENGISQKGPSPGNASHYLSLTRLRSTGNLTVGGETFAVTGLSWMDHEFGTSFLEEDQTGWDWFSIQLDDNRELMIFQIRRADGSIDARSSGTMIEANGRTVHIPFTGFALKPTGASWRSQSSGANYPTEWLIELPGFDLRLQVSAAFENQELRTTESTAVTYWEGSVTVDAVSGGRKISGRGYLEMTGYAGPNMGAVFQ
jgi:predicted secreted hydrolase